MWRTVRRAVVLAMTASVAATTIATTATAQVGTGPPRPAPSNFADQAAECARQQHIDPLALPHTTFFFDAQGNVICSRGSTNGPGSLGSLIPTLLLIAVLWALIPSVIAAVVANSRGESMGLAVLLTLVLGWIGLAITVFGQRRSQRAVVEALDGGRRPPVPNREMDLTDRLRTLDELRNGGAITAGEHATRRQELLQSV